MIQLANKNPTVNRTTTSCSLSSQDLGDFMEIQCCKGVIQSFPSAGLVAATFSIYGKILWQLKQLGGIIYHISMNHPKNETRTFWGCTMYKQLTSIKHTNSFVMIIHITYVKNTMIRDSFRPFIQHSSSPQNHCNTPLNCWADFWVVEIPGGAEGPGAWLPRPKVAHLWLEVTKPKPTPVPTPSAG